MPIGKRLGAEFLGSLMIVLAGCGTAVIAATTPALGIGAVGVALASGFTMLAMMFALSHVSGGHFNPAITIGMSVAKRFPGKDVLPYALAQIAGAIIGAATVFLIASGKTGFEVGSFAANGFAERSPGNFSVTSAMVTEILITFGLVTVFINTHERRALAAHAPIAVGLAAVVGKLIAIPVTMASMNPAHSTGTALFAGSNAIAQLWLFWLAPMLGGTLAGVVHPLLSWTPNAPGPGETP